MSSTSLSTLREVFVKCREMDGSLGERLELYSQAVRDLIPSYAEAVDGLIDRLHSSGAGAGAPRPGELMPPFVLPDETGRLASLEEFLANGPVAITFHRGHWCPWCRISINALVRVHDQIAEAGGQVVAIMPDRQRFAAEFKRDAQSPFPVLTDMDNGYALSLNLAIWLGPDLERLLSSYGRVLPEYHGNDAWTLPIPATFIVGQDGIIRKRFVDPDFRQRMAVEQLIDALRTRQ
ncbi:MAG: peroxiredoxin-like family protein [Xanthobacteraceae bacterium]